MPTQTHIEMPYGQGRIDFDVPSANLLGVWAPRAMPPAPDAQAEIERALAHPIGGPTLADLAHQARRVVIVADDNTRPTPTQIIMPVLLNALNCAGVPDSAIQVVIALGTHRKMDQNEITAKFGDEVVCRVPVVNHDAFDPGALMDLENAGRGGRAAQSHSHGG